MPTFAQPLWLLTGLVACFAAVLFISFNIIRRKKELQTFAAVNLLPGLTTNVSTSRRRLKNILFILGLACLFLALARPQYGNRWIEVRRKGIDILIGVDVSKSMLVPDISPNRLERAKLAIRDFVGKLEGDRVGLLPFAGTAFLMCPLTTDYDAFTASLDAIDVNTIPKGGTDIGTAIREGGEALANEANHKILVLVTDGEDLSEDALKAAEKAKAEKMTIYTIGVGTPEGELVPLPGGQPGSFVKDAQGNFVTSKLDEHTLTTIAEATGGLYVPLGSMGQGFETVYQRKLALLPKEEHGQRKQKIPIERFPWPLGAALLLLGADFLLTGRKSSRSLRLPFVKTAGRRKKQQATAAVLLIALFFGATSGRASQGEELFQAGDYSGAEKYYHKALEKDKDDPALHFNLGGTLYRQKKYEQAAAEFNQALATENLNLQAKSYYNRGNSQYFLGAAQEAADAEQALKQWSGAKKSFEAALQLQPEDKAAAHNLEMISKKLEQLKEKMRNSGKQCNNPQSGKDGDQQKDGQDKKKEEQQPQDQNSADGKEQQEEQQESSSPQEQPAGQQEDAEEQPEQQAAPEPAEEAEPEKKEETPAVEDIQQAAAEENEQSGQQEEKKQQMSEEDMQRRMMGRMTEQEAKNLLDSLKGEQGELNFIPQGAPDDEPVRKDW
ncbi:MAG: VWA domain-containing protein [Candidatus Electrothrix sp. YB6]